jgi:hypothetical protein
VNTAQSSQHKFEAVAALLAYYVFNFCLFLAGLMPISHCWAFDASMDGKDV